MDQTFHSYQPVGIKLPEPIKDLERLSKNFYWSWHPEGVQLFRDLDSMLWDKVEQHPQKMLSDTSELLLWQNASDPDYLNKLREFAEKFDGYMAGKPKVFDRVSPERPAAQTSSPSTSSGASRTTSRKRSEVRVQRALQIRRRERQLARRRWVWGAAPREA